MAFDSLAWIGSVRQEWLVGEVGGSRRVGTWVHEWHEERHPSSPSSQWWTAAVERRSTPRVVLVGGLGAWWNLKGLFEEPQSPLADRDDDGSHWRQIDNSMPYTLMIDGPWRLGTMISLPVDSQMNPESYSIFEKSRFENWLPPSQESQSPFERRGVVPWNERKVVSSYSVLQIRIYIVLLETLPNVAWWHGNCNNRL